MGHTKVRCKEPIVEDDGGAGDFNAGGGGHFGSAEVAPATNGWDDGGAAPGW